MSVDKMLGLFVAFGWNTKTDAGWQAQPSPLSSIEKTSIYLSSS
jgi:hypothetical protein